MRCMRHKEGCGCLSGHGIGEGLSSLVAQSCRGYWDMKLTGEAGSAREAGSAGEASGAGEAGLACIQMPPSQKSSFRK